MSSLTNQLLSVHLQPCPPTPRELEQRKLDRLRELRAVIDSLREGAEHRDPLLAWAIAQERSQEKAKTDRDLRRD
jgi:hypothetical protein